MENWKPQLPSGPTGLDGATVDALRATFEHWLNRINKTKVTEDSELIGFSCSPIDPPVVQSQAGRSDFDHLPLMRQTYALRRLRSDIFPYGLFSDPAWDMLIDLYISLLEHRAVSVSSACIASCSPPTTALRHITTLQENGLVVRRPDLRDGRRIHLELSAAGVKLMSEWAQKAQKMLMLQQNHTRN